MTSQAFTRDERRQMRAHAKTLAPLFARTCANRDPRTGKTELVSHPQAVAALERIFRLVLIEGGAVQIMRLSEATAAAFPAFDPATIPAGSKAWLAAGLEDVDGRGTFSIRHISSHGSPHALTDRRIAEAAMLAELSPSLSRSGWPAEARAHERR